MLEDRDMDAVSICTLVHLHKEHVVDSCKYRKNILVEKPMARGVNGCREMVSA